MNRDREASIWRCKGRRYSGVTQIGLRDVTKAISEKVLGFAGHARNRV